MANVYVNETSLQDIADSIRAKNGTQNTYKPGEMAAAIDALPSGGITPSGTLEITANGTYDVTNYASAEVDVPARSPVINPLSVTANGTYTAPSGVDGYSPVTVNVPSSTPTGTKQINITANGTTTEDVSAYANAEITVNVSGGGSADWDGFVKGTWPTGAVTLGNDITSIPAQRFRGLKGITQISAPAVTTVMDYAFYSCSGIQTASFPELTTISGDYAFYGCDAWTTIHLPKVTAVNSTYAFKVLSNTARKTLVLPSVTSMKSDSLRDLLADAVDLGEGLTALPIRCFYGWNSKADQYIHVILRCKSQVVNASASNCVYKINANTTVYVPQALLSSYQADSVWSTKNLSAIEGSAYENYYADGTPIS